MTNLAGDLWQIEGTPRSVALVLVMFFCLAASSLLPAQQAPSVQQMRRVRVFPRSSHPFHFDTFESAGGERIIAFTGGINLLVEDLQTGDLVDVVADRAVLWTRGGLADQIATSGVRSDSREPLEVYLEGNVLLRSGNLRSLGRSDSSVLSGKQAYVDVPGERALILDGNVETFDEELQLPLFVRGREIRQLSANRFRANQASVTTSIYRGTPGYRFTSREVYVDRVDQRIENPLTHVPLLDPVTGEPAIRTRYFATSYDNVLLIGNIPVFYWPYLRVDVEDPLGPLEDYSIGRTKNLGFITTVGLDIWQLTGLDYLPIAEHSEWLLDLGYYSKRGIAVGNRYEYSGDRIFGAEGYHHGQIQSWAIHDTGKDILGRLPSREFFPPRKLRERFRLQHRQRLPHDLTLLTELSYLSDRHLLESFFEEEFDTGKDQDTLLYLKQARNQWAWTFLAQPRINDFLPQNPWLPRLDGYLIGLPLLDDRLTYFGHSSVGYAQLRPPDVLMLPSDRSAELLRFDTRHELDMPVQLGPLKVTPFVVGEFTLYTETPTSADGVGRLYGAAGLRSSLQFWQLFPDVRSHLFDVHGLAHRVSVNVDYRLARSNRDFRTLPTLDQPDDDTSELIRRQNLLRTFGTTPLSFDPRFFAHRFGVTTLPDILDDMQNVRLGLLQRLQTKRGPLDQQRVIDWMVLDVGLTIFPERDRDNFGELAGLIDYSYEWHIGDRTAFTSNFLADPHNDTISVNGVMNFQRPPRSTLSIFVSHFDTGPFVSNYVGASTLYQFSEKYSGTISFGRDLEVPDSFSYNFLFTRMGLDFVTSLGIVFNSGRDDFGFRFGIVPRAQAASGMSLLGGGSLLESFNTN